MNESSDEPPLQDRLSSWALVKAHASKYLPFGANDNSPTLPLVNSSPSEKDARNKLPAAAAAPASSNEPLSADATVQSVADNRSSTLPPPAPPPLGEKPEGEASSTIDSDSQPSTLHRFYKVGRTVIFHTWVNVLLIFVPVGIILGALNKSQGNGHHVLSPSIVFAMNAIAIIPLAGLLSYATESVAAKLGDTMGALLNVSFGNAVELIIFIIALVAKEIRIVQASLLGSILANLLLILGMCFLFGGLRFREQLYNSTVTQMSACLLSLSVISLLLPTAFHASFNNTELADRAVIKVSRGTSVILLLVYVLYLLFQLKSHSYMYESTPQHMIDEESHPGVLADFLGSSSSSDSSSSSSSDTDASSGSNTTAKRFKKHFKRRKRRKSSASSKETPSMPSVPSVERSSSMNTQGFEDAAASPSPAEHNIDLSHALEAVESGDEADTDGAKRKCRRRTKSGNVKSKDFLTGKTTDGSPLEPPDSHPKKKHGKKHKKSHKKQMDQGATSDKNETTLKSEERRQEPDLEMNQPRVGFVGDLNDPVDGFAKKPFSPRALSVRPAFSKVLSSTVFSPSPQTIQPVPSGLPLALPSRTTTNTLRRASSLPDRLNQGYSSQPAPSAQPLPHIMPPTPSADSKEDEKVYLSRTSAIILLLISTGLVAVCAEFLVDSIDYIVEESGVSQAFIGLIILPIVGNAAEHVTAVTVASKNKMDLAIGVAVGSSIQIALFVTPIIVLLGWCLDTEMSLYFSLFETVSLFVSAFIVGFLVLDGRSNYLEGALLIAAYVIIAVLAYFYPSCENLSLSSGPQDPSGAC